MVLKKVLGSEYVVLSWHIVYQQLEGFLSSSANFNFHHRAHSCLPSLYVTRSLWQTRLVYCDAKCNHIYSDSFVKIIQSKRTDLGGLLEISDNKPVCQEMRCGYGIIARLVR